MIDPVYNDADGWNTIYVKGVYHEKGPDASNQGGLHITFAVTRYHNCYYDNFYYAYFDFDDRRLYSPNGRILYYIVQQNEYENPLYQMQFHSEGVQAFRNVDTVLGLDHRKHIHIFFTNYDETSAHRTAHSYWSGADWITRVFYPTWHGYLKPLDVQFDPGAEKYWLYLERSEIYPTQTKRVVRWYVNNYNATELASTKVLIGYENYYRSFHEGALIQNRQPELEFLFKDKPGNPRSNYRNDGLVKPADKNLGIQIVLILNKPLLCKQFSCKDNSWDLENQAVPFT